MWAHIIGSALLLVGCRYGASDFPTHTKADAGHKVEVKPPAAPTPEGEVLHQVLYKDEYGSFAHPSGQRARMLAWLVSLELEPTQLAGLGSLCTKVEEIRSAEAEDRRNVGQLETQHMGPVHAAIITQLASGVLPEPAEATELAGRLEAAQGLAYADGLPLVRQRKRTGQVIAQIMVWIKSLSQPQLNQVSSARYFLRRRAGPLVNPGQYAWVVGSQWDMGDFDLLRFSGDSKTDGGIDLAGLWLLEDHRVKEDGRLNLLQAAGIAALAVTEPGLPQAIEVLQGRRQPLDFSGTPH